MFQGFADENMSIELIRALVVTCSSPDKDFEVGVSVVEEKESKALQDPSLQQRMLNGYTEDKLRAGM